MHLAEQTIHPASGVVIGVVKERGLLHAVLIRHLVVVEEAAGASAHALGLVLDPLAHAARLDHLRAPGPRDYHPSQNNSLYNCVPMCCCGSKL